jgi:hypothetical protein
MARPLSLAFLLLALAANVGAAEKTDLSEFFAPGGAPGDFKVWRSDADGTRLDELLDVQYAKKRVYYLARRTEDGVETLSISGLIPGKWLLEGSAMIEELEIDVAKPVKVLPLRVVIGKPHKYRGGGKVYYLGERVGKAKLTGSITFTGFGPVVTPYWNVSDAASFVESSALTIKIKGGGELRVEGTSSWSTDRELGSIAGVSQSRTFEDGVLVDEEGPTTWWFESGVLGGVAVP